MPEVIFVPPENEADRLVVTWKGGWWTGQWDIAVQQKGEILAHIHDTKKLEMGQILPLPNGDEIYLQMTDWGMKVQRNGHELRRFRDPTAILHAAQISLSAVGYTELVTAGLLSFFPGMIEQQGFSFPGAPFFQFDVLGYLLLFIIVGAALLLIARQIGKRTVTFLSAAVALFWFQMIFLAMQTGIALSFVFFGLAFTVLLILAIRAVIDTRVEVKKEEPPAA